MLDEANLLGKGAYKSAYNIDESSVFLTPIQNPISGASAHTMADLIKESQTLDFINSYDIPTLNISKVGQVNLSEGNIQGLISDKMYFITLLHISKMQRHCL